MGFLDSLFGGASRVGGSPDPTGAGLSALGAAMLQNNSPSLYKKSVFQILGESLPEAQKAYRSAADSEIINRALGAGNQQELMAALSGVQDPRIQEMLLRNKLGFGNNTPANIQEWQYFDKLSPENQQRYLNMKRSNQTLNLGGSQMVIGANGQPISQYDVTPKPEQDPDFQRKQAEARAEGKLAGEAGSAIPKLGGLIASLEALKESSTNAPSGMLENLGASIANVSGYGGDASNAQADFTTKRAAAENEIRQAFRVVGSGATSDADAKPFIEMLPTANDSASSKITKTDAALQAVQMKIEALAKQRGVNLAQPADTMAMPQEPPTLNKPQQPQDTQEPIQLQKGTKDYGNVILKAKSAIAQGRDPEAIKARLQKHGINPADAGL